MNAVSEIADHRYPGLHCCDVSARRKEGSQHHRQSWAALCHQLKRKAVLRNFLVAKEPMDDAKNSSLLECFTPLSLTYTSISPLCFHEILASGGHIERAHDGIDRPAHWVHRIGHNKSVLAPNSEFLALHAGQTWVVPERRHSRADALGDSPATRQFDNLIADLHPPGFNGSQALRLFLLTTSLLSSKLLGVLLRLLLVLPLSMGAQRTLCPLQ